MQTLRRVTLATWVLSAVVLASSICCRGQSHDGLCNAGFGEFQTKFATGVSVTVGAVRNGGFVTRACSATLAWGKQELPVISGAAMVDIDALGVDLGLGPPIVAFQTKTSDADWFVTYKIYSLEKPPRLLRTITGGSSFAAADTDLDGRIEIWTDDAKAVDGMDHLSVGELDFAPTLVLRFNKHTLLDVSSEFQSQFDHQIAEIRAHLDSKQLSDFKDSDGKVSERRSLPAEQMHRLRQTKIRVLEIVWEYLYSGREVEAWQALTEMWPAADFERVRTVLTNARASGIRSQIDGSATARRFHGKKLAHIYETAGENSGRPPDALNPGSANLMADTKPQAILLRRVAVGDTRLTQSEEEVDVVIDAAGKVRSAKTVGKQDVDLLNSCTGWKFIPAFKDGGPVASRMRLALFDFR
jgi:hypothetical protein